MTQQSPPTSTTKTNATTTSTTATMDDGAIAIVGMACRFASATSPSKLWEMIEQGRSGHSRIPKRSFDVDGWYHPSRHRRGAIITKSGFFLDDVSHFDAPFFSVTATEAAAMDPMQRLGLEVAYESFENAGIPMENLAQSRTAVYSACMTADYQDVAEGDLYRLGDHAASGTSKAILSNRISWFFDLRGPSLTLDTACSSGLYGLHLACQAIKAGECDQALVTGTNLILHPNLVAQFTSMHMISPDGISHAWDASANGYGRGEGIAGLFVKRLDHALRDGDVIRAIIRNTGANHDGKTTGMTVPSGAAHARLIRATYEEAGLPLEETCYFEAHGTGTPLGDPIELRALGQTIGDARKHLNRPLYVGSVKTNVGHTEGASGLAGVIKAVMVLETGVIPSVAGLKNVNPELHLADWNLALPMENVAWPDDGPRRASVNSFGFGGSNAHTILEDTLHYTELRGLKSRHVTSRVPLLNGSPAEHIKRQASSSPSSDVVQNGEATVAQQQERHQHLFVLSAQDQGGLNRIASSYSEYFKQEPLCSDENLEDATAAMQSTSHILASRRAPLDFRSFVVADSWSDLITSLGTKEKNSLPRERASGRNKIAFVFTGQGAQRPGMARELLSDPVFSASIRRSQKIIDSCNAGWDIADLLTNAGADTMGQSRYSQPLCTAIQLGLVDLLASWGVKPSAVVGHSSGEIAAAYASGAMTHEDATFVSYNRGVLSSVVGPRGGIDGSMLAAGLSESEAREYIAPFIEKQKDSVTIACINSPSSVTLSGISSTIDEVHEALVKDGKFSRQVRTGVAYHSTHMGVVAEDGERDLAELTSRLQPTQVPMYSSVTERPIDGKLLGGSYWMENMMNTVRFAGALRNLVTGNDSGSQTEGEEFLDTEYSAIIEIGPSRTLGSPVSQILNAVSPRLVKKLPYRSMLVAGKHARQTALEAAGFLWSTGHSVDVDKVNRLSDSIVLDLSMLPTFPSYPWNHDHSFWHENTITRAHRLRSEPRTDLLGVSVEGQNPFEPRWRNVISVAENPWLTQHRVASAVLFPAAGYLVMALEAVLKLAKNETTRPLKGVEFTNVTFETGLALQEDGSGTEISLTIKPHAVVDDMYEFSVYSDPPGQEVRRLVVGSVAAVFGATEADRIADRGFEEEAQEEEWVSARVLLNDSQKSAVNTVDVPSFYDNLANIGLEYGPLFQGLKSIATTPAGDDRVAGTAFGSLVIPDTKSSMPEQFEYPHLLHPATLDAAFHLAFAALQTREDMRRPAVPVSVSRIYIASDLVSEPGHKFLGTASTKRIAKSAILADVLFANEDANGPKMVIEAMRLSDLGDASPRGADGIDSVSLRRSANIVWKKDVAFTQPPSNMKPSTVRSWLASWFDEVLHKHASAKTLFVGANPDELLLEVLRSRMASQEKVSTQSTLFSRTLPQESSDVQAYIQTLEAEGPYDAVIVAAQKQEVGSLLKSMPRLAKPNASVVLLGDEGVQIRKPVDSELVPAIVSSQNTLSSLDSLQKNSVTILERSADKITPDALQLREVLVGLLRDSGIATKVENTVQGIASLPACTDAYVISLIEYGRPLVYDWAEDDLAHFKDMVASSRYLMWLTSGGLMAPEKDGLKYSATTGLLRTVRAEYPQLVLPHVDISPKSLSLHETAASIIADILAATLTDSDTPVETEFAELNGKIFVPRLLGNAAMDAELALDADKSVTLDIQLDGCDKSLQLCDTASGLQWTPCEASKLDVNDVLIETKYIAGSVQQSQKQGDPLWTLVGAVNQVGPFVTDYKPGDLVLPLNLSEGIRTRFTEDADTILKVPQNVSPAQVAYWMGPLSVAHHLLVGQQTLPLSLSSLEISRHESKRRARRAPMSDTPPESADPSPPRSPPTEAELPQVDTRNVLIDVEDGALRSALVQVAQWLGMDTFVMSPPGKEVLGPEFDGEFCTIIRRMTRSSSWMVKKKTSGAGVDLVLSSLQDPSSMQHLMASVASEGRFVAIGAPAKQDMNFTIVPRFDVSFSRLDSSKLSDSSMREAQRAILGLVSRNTIALPPLSPSSRQPVSRMNLLQDTTTRDNRLVFSVEPTSLVPMQLSGRSSLPESKLDPAGTYIISGGMGALGLEMAGWLSEQGARHLVLLSRSGKPNAAAVSAINNLAQQGCCCEVVRCDITSPTAVREVASQAARNKWTIRGIVQSAMVLADTPLETMTADQWNTATAPKTHGSWNLHEILGDHKDLDFFVLLSSISGIIGNSAQANYAAGNTFEDALAAYRRREGLPAVSLNLGLVAVDTGNIGSVDEFVQKFPHLAPVMVSTKELRAGLHLAMRGRGLDNEPLPSQVVVGISDQIPADDGVGSSWPRDPKFAHRLDSQAEEANGQDEKKVNYEKALKAAMTTEEARMVVEDALRVQVAVSMSCDAADVDVEKPLTAFGIDSLKATEVRNWIQKEFSSRLSIFEILSPTPISRLSLSISKNSAYITAPAA